MVQCMAKKTYTPIPEVPEALRQRYQVMLQVLSGELTVSEGARRLGLSRNYFQTLMHEGLAGMIKGLTPKPAGRPAKPEREAELEAEAERLRRENERLRKRVETIDRLLGVASEVLQGRTAPARERKTAKTTKPGGNNDEDPEPEARLHGAEVMRQ